MTGRTDLDREMAAYFESRRTNRAPDGLLDAALASVESTRQRPGWLIPERWVPSRVRRGVARTARLAVVLAMLASLVGIALAIGILVGSRPKLPPPFGIAGPGLIALELGGDIVVVNPDGTGIVQLTSGPSVDVYPTFSPDGTLIAYESSTALVVMGPHGEHPLTLEDHLAVLGAFAWSPDSRRIAFGAREAGSNDWHIYVADVDRPGRTQLGGPDTLGEHPSWSPDGTAIAFKRSHACCGPSGLPEALWLMGADGSNPHQLWEGHYIDADWDTLYNTAWSPDSKRLAFLAHGVGAAYDIYVVNRDGTDPRNLTQSEADEYWPTWSPDGQRLAFYVRDDSDGIAVVDPDGSNPVRLRYPSLDGQAPVWSPDGKRLFAYVWDDALGGRGSIVIFDPTGVRDPITIPAVNVGSASWQRIAPP